MEERIKELEKALEAITKQICTLIVISNRNEQRVREYYNRKVSEALKSVKGG